MNSIGMPSSSRLDQSPHIPPPEQPTLSAVGEGLMNLLDTIRQVNMRVDSLNRMIGGEESKDTGHASPQPNNLIQLVSQCRQEMRMIEYKLGNLGV